MRSISLIRVTLVLLLTAAPAFAQETPSDASLKLPKYPLRLHILAADDTHKTARMQPNACAGMMPEMTGGVGGGEAGGGCQSSSGTLSFGGDDDFSGGGRGDLVLPPKDTRGLQFTYEGCPRVRVLPGFQSLQARWKKNGKSLEVLVPSDAISHQDGPLPTQKCTFKVTMRDFVYLRVRNGSILQVSQDAYWKKPALRMYLSGGSEVLERRTPPTVTVKELVPSTKPGS